MKKMFGGDLLKDQYGNATKRGNLVLLSVLVVPSVNLLITYVFSSTDTQLKSMTSTCILYISERRWILGYLNTFTRVYHIINSIYGIGKFHKPRTRNCLEGDPTPFPTSISPKNQGFHEFPLCNVVW